MILSRRVSLDGQQLDQQNAAIIVRSVSTGSPRSEAQMTPLMDGVGQRITSLRWSEMIVTVRYAIDLPKRELYARRQAYEAACAWALSGRGKWLRVDYMAAERRLYVDRVEIADPADLWEWTSEYTITFHAVSVPFWQDAASTSSFASVVIFDEGTSETWPLSTMTIPGQVRTVLDVSLKNDGSSALTSVAISAGTSTMTLTGLSLASGKRLIISHTAAGLLQITEDGVDAYAKQAAGGSTDLYVDPGDQEISITIDHSATVTFSCYGRYA